MDSYKGQADDPLSLNLYTYCYNNSVVFIDTTGNMQKWASNFLINLGKGIGLINSVPDKTRDTVSLYKRLFNINLSLKQHKIVGFQEDLMWQDLQETKMGCIMLHKMHYCKARNM